MFFFTEVCRSSKCATIIGRYLVRRSSRIQEKKHDSTIAGSWQTRSNVSDLQHDLYDGTYFADGIIYEEAICQIHMPFRIIRFLPKLDRFTFFYVLKYLINLINDIWFAVLLGMASQRIEYLLIELFGNAWMREILAGWKKRERGCIPGFVETGVVIYVISKHGYINCNI